MMPRVAVVVLVAVLSAALAHAQATPPAQSALSASQTLALATEKYQEAKDQKDAAMLREALELVRGVLAGSPLDIDANLLAGDILVDANDYDRARDYYRVVLDVDPVNYRANLGYGKILNANRSWRQAAAFLEKAERVATDTQRRVDVKRALAMAYAGMGDLTRATDKAAEAVRVAPDDFDARRTLVEIRLALMTRFPEQIAAALSDTDAFVERARQSVQEKPWDRERLTRLNDAYELELSALRELQRSYYERDARNQPTNRLLRGKEVEAAAALNRMAEIIAEQAVLKRTLAEHDALMLIEMAVQYDPRSVRYLENLVATCQRISDRDKAVAACRKILKLDPNHAGARKYLQDLGEPIEDPSAPATGEAGPE